MSIVSATDPVYHPPMEPYVSIIHREADFLVLDKPGGLLSVPGRHPALADSLATRVQTEFPNALMINRLDKDTSGIVLMSLNRKAHAFIAAQFEARTTEKTYIADVWGYLQEREGLIDLPLAIDPEHKPRHRVDHAHGKSAQTRWKVLGYGTGTTRLELSPLTGRTHQLRVHMQAIGHVIIGDEFYAQGEALSAASRLHLHAQMLQFQHPDGRRVVFTAPYPF